MTIINDFKVTISSFTELKETLENYNNYNYIYLENDVTINEDIFINDFREKVTIDGTYLGNKYALYNSDYLITSGAKLKKFIFKNINISSTNQKGIIYVPFEKYYEDEEIIFSNIVFTGISLASLGYSNLKILNSIISVDDTDNIQSNYVAEANHIFIGGNTTIDSSSLHKQIFNFNTALQNPLLYILPNAEVVINSENRELINNTLKLDFKVLHDSKFMLKSANGFAIVPTHGCQNVLIDTNATFNFIENKHQRIPMWVIYGTLTLNEGSNLSVINSYDQTPSDNYNILFRGLESKLILNNPESFIIYTKNANIIYALATMNFELNFTRLNLWNNSVELTSSGTINTLPDLSYFKNEDLAQIHGTIFGSETTVTSHNLDNVDMSNFTFQNKKMFSVGRSIINIHPINKEKNIIEGHTQTYSDVLIKYSDKKEIVSCDENGYFKLNLDTALNDNNSIEITSCVPGSFIYETRNIITPFNGELTLIDAPKTINFENKPASLDPYIFYKKDNTVLKIIDSRTMSTPLKIYASLTKTFASENGYTLDGAIVFKNFSDQIIVLDTYPTLVLTLDDINLVQTITLSKEKGILLYIDNKYLEINEDYQTKITWKVE